MAAALNPERISFNPIVPDSPVSAAKLKAGVSPNPLSTIGASKEISKTLFFLTTLLVSPPPSIALDMELPKATTNNMISINPTPKMAIIEPANEAKNIFQKFIIRCVNFGVKVCISHRT